MGVSYDPVWEDSKMASPVKLEAPQPVAALSSSQEGDFYMATFRDGKIRKVGCKMKDGPPLRVRRVLEFNSKAELAKEQALTLKRKQLGSGLEIIQAPPSGKKEKTLAEVLLDIKRKKIGEALATVQRKPPMILALEASGRPKKRKRRSTSALHSCSELPVPDSSPPRDDELTLAEWLKKSVSTTGRASSDNAGIKVFQRRKVKFKAIRRRGTTNACSNGEGYKRPSSPVTVCENLCDCDECSPNDDIAAPKTASDVPRPMTCSRVSTSTGCRVLTTQVSEIQTSVIVAIDSDDHPNSSRSQIDATMEDTEPSSRRDVSVGEFDTLTLTDDSSQALVAVYDQPAHAIREIEEKFLEEFCGDVSQQDPSNTAVTAQSSDFASPASPVPENFCASSVGPDEVLNAAARAHLIAETTTFAGPLHPVTLNGDAHFPAEDSVSGVTSMELELAEVRIDALLDTLVTPDELLPSHLSASKSSHFSKSIRKSRKRSLCEPVTFAEEGSSSGPATSFNNNLSVFQKQEENLTEQISLDLTTRILKSVTVRFPCSVSDPVMEESLTLRERILKSVTVGLPSSVNDPLEEVPLFESSELPVPHAPNEPQEHGIAHEPVVGFDSETTVACRTNEAAVFPSFQEAAPVNTEERTSSAGSDILMAMSDAVEVTETPVTSPCNEDSAICQTTALDAAERDNDDAAERDADDAAGSLSSKAFFSNLTTDTLSKRNRKSFSPNSRLALIEAAGSERTTPTFKIKLMKSKMRDSCSSKLVSRKKVKSKAFLLQDQSPIPDDTSAQDTSQPEVEQIQLVAAHPLSPPQTTDAPEIPAPCLSGPPPDSSTRTVPGSPEYQKEPFVPLETGTESVEILSTPDTPVGTLACIPLQIGTEPVDILSTPDTPVGNLVTCTEGSVLVDLDCRPGSPTDPCTPSGKPASVSPQPRSILKTRSLDPHVGAVTCRGICKCPRCVSTRDQSEAARDFIKSQMNMANSITSKLITELRNMRALVEEDAKPHAGGDAAAASGCPSDKAKGALESATKTETWATKEILKLSRDSKRVCRLIETGPRRTIFADDAGRQLCHVKILPAKKSMLVNL